MQNTAALSILLPPLDSSEVLELSYKIARSVYTKRQAYTGVRSSFLDVDDLAQIIRLQVWQKQAEYRAIPGVAWEAWVWRVGTNACINAYGREGRNKAVSLEALEVVLSDSVATLGGLDEVEANRVIQELVAQLTPLEQTVLYLKLCGRTGKEIASILTSDNALTIKSMNTDKRYLAGQVKAFYSYNTYTPPLDWGVTTERRVHAIWDKIKRKAEVFAIEHNLTKWLGYIRGDDYGKANEG